MGKLDRKVAIITGAARGQGEAEARLFAEEGASILLGDILDGPGEQVAREIGSKALYQHLDVTEPTDWAAAVHAATATFGKVNVLINNAGIVKEGLLEDQRLEDFLAVIQVNIVGCFLGMQAVIPALRAAGGGSIVNVSATGGIEGVAGLSAYVSSKFAVRGITKCAALELGRHGIRVNSVHPGGIDTEMARQSRDPGEGYATLPLGRIGRPDEVAKLMVFLASDDSSYCTGAEFIIDGGLLAGEPLPEPLSVS